MQNEPNFRKGQMNVCKVITKNYENKCIWTLGENEPKTNPIKANFKGKIMQSRIWIYTAEVSIIKILLEWKLGLIFLRNTYRLLILPE